MNNNDDLKKVADLLSQANTIVMRTKGNEQGFLTKELGDLQWEIHQLGQKVRKLMNNGQVKDPFEDVPGADKAVDNKKNQSSAAHAGTVNLGPGQRPAPPPMSSVFKVNK